MNNRSFIKNKSGIEELFLAGVRAVDSYELTRRSMILHDNILNLIDYLGHRECYDLSKFKRILVVGFGKAACPMAKAVEEILQHRIFKGLIITPYGTSMKMNLIKVTEAGHPIPDSNGIHGAQQIADMLQDAMQEDLVILLISGGGSALCTLPAPGINIDDLRKISEALLGSSANIEEINTVRKHLSLIKGGQLAKFAYPATTLALIISDVIGDPTHAIASGPAVPDPSTFSEASDILKKYGLSHKIPFSIRSHIEGGRRGEIAETPKSDEVFFRATRNIIIGNNLIALRSIAERAKQKGYEPLIISSRISGDVREVAKVFASMIKEFTKNPVGVSMPACIISGGEMTIRVTGKGMGGRNQDFCLSLVPSIKGLERVEILSAGTDGIDGCTDAAGAIVDGHTYARAKELGLDIDGALAEYDSHRFFKAMDSLVITGPTGTNVMDIQIVLIS
ncbi:MAG: glycerate kinase [candidate division WOR-3 bacterium]|nr:MAG: glycerate kinase [candidate division WOR-3 bacterium]